MVISALVINGLT